MQNSPKVVKHRLDWSLNFSSVPVCRSHCNKTTRKIRLETRIRQINRLARRPKAQDATDVTAGATVTYKHNKLPLFYSAFCK